MIRYNAPIPRENPFTRWLAQAEIALSYRLLPDALLWTSAEREPPEGQFFAENLPPRPNAELRTITPRFLAQARMAIWHKNPARFDILYRRLWRITYPNHGVGDDASAAIVQNMARQSMDALSQIMRETAFVQVIDPQGNVTLKGQFSSPHHLLEPAAQSFMRRFAQMPKSPDHWQLYSPEGMAEWQAKRLRFYWGMRPRDRIMPLQQDIPLPQNVTRPHSTTHGANVMLGTSQSKAVTPKICPAPLTASPQPREKRIVSTVKSDPKRTALYAAHYRAKQCQRCALGRGEHKLIWGRGNPHASIMLVLGQARSDADLNQAVAAKLNALCKAAGFHKDDIYQSFALKHPSATNHSRLPSSPSPRGEILACRDWLTQELRIIAPKIIVAFGATAAFALTGNDTPHLARRGQIEIGLDERAILVSTEIELILNDEDREQMLFDLKAAHAYAFEAEA